MVDFNKWRCRNCKHWHDADMPDDAACNYETIAMKGPCGCANWESNDNLVYLEMKYEKTQSR